LHAIVDPDVEFSMPGKTIHGAQDYITALRRLGPITLRNDVKKVFVDGNEVCVIYDFVTDTSVGAVPSVEWLTVESGRIRSIRLIFHSQPWPGVLEELSRRTRRVSGEHK
jgi:SnoaL-like domain